MKPSLPKGTRDFIPSEMQKRQYIFDIIRSHFNHFGYFPIETPALENLSTLSGKYGDEGDQLLFKVLNNGDFLAGIDPSLMENPDSKKMATAISKRGLRYDLTVPFARFIVMNRHQIKFPFKRSAIQPVWRADRPQKGRYQEFYQCDADVAGSDALIYEAELILLYDRVFADLKLPVKIMINNRKLLAGMAQKTNLADRFESIMASIDKLDKIGTDGVQSELIRKEVPEQQAIDLLDLVHESDLDQLHIKLSGIPDAEKGYDEVKTVLNMVHSSPVFNDIVFEPTLARGLSYYTGCIFEVQALEANMGSIGGGGRYDGLTSLFGMHGVSGVGISFGAERIYDILEEKNLFPPDINRPNLLCIAMDHTYLNASFQIAMKLRSFDISCDIYPESAKMQKMMSYANDLRYKWVLIMGEQEVALGIYTLKNMDTGEQSSLNEDQLVVLLKEQ